MGRRSRLVAGSVLAVLLAVMVVVNPPEDCSNPWTLRLVLVPFKLVALTCDLLEPMFGDRIHTSVGRTLMEVTYTLRGLPQDNPQLQITQTTLGGVPAVIYRPKTLPASGARALIYIHGGGWAFGSVVGFDRQSQSMALGAGVVVVAIEYRRAPEHVFPAPLEDCETATIHLLQHAETYGVDPHRVAISGDSAGGNLATAVSLSLRDKGVTPRLALQVLIYPVLQAADFLTPSYRQHEHHAVVRKHIMVTCWMWYLFGDVSRRHAFFTNQHTPQAVKAELQEGYMSLSALPSERRAHAGTLPQHTTNATLWAEVKALVTNPLVSPLLAPDVGDLPPTYFLTVEQDILLDEGLWFVQRLRAAGVTVTHRHYTASFHGGLVFADRFHDSQVMLDDMVAFVRDHL